MKNLTIWSRTADRTIMMAVIVVTVLAGVAFIGYSLPTVIPGQANDLRIADAIMATAIGILIWGVFKLIEPSGFTGNGRKWLVAEFTVVPLVWILLLVVLGLWFRHQSNTYDFDQMNVLKCCFQ